MERRIYQRFHERLAKNPCRHILSCLDTEIPGGLVFERWNETVRTRLRSLPSSPPIQEAKRWAVQAANGINRKLRRRLALAIHTSLMNNTHHHCGWHSLHHCGPCRLANRTPPSMLHLSQSSRDWFLGPCRCQIRALAFFSGRSFLSFILSSSETLYYLSLCDFVRRLEIRSGWKIGRSIKSSSCNSTEEWG